MARPTVSREDISRFVVHLTKDTYDGSAADNLISILRAKRIEARTPHCLFKYKIEKGKFDESLKKRFFSVCFTETPLSQIRFLSGDIPGRKVLLQPYGLVFKRSTMLEKGASPAIYLNGDGTQHKRLLLDRFKSDFSEIETLADARAKHGEVSEALISYYALCNIMAGHHDFSWEREWRYCSDFDFKYFEVIAILVNGTLKFKNRLEADFSASALRHLRKIPLINPDWNYERVVDQMSQLIKATYKAFDEKTA
jgi:hypothetical protein